MKSAVLKYVGGFIGALIMTAAAFSLVQSRILMGGWLVALLMLFAVVQLWIQLTFFLHVGEEAKPRWRLTALLFTAVMVLVIVIGSLWIMYHLNYNMMMTPQQMDTYMKAQAKKGF